MNKVSFFWRLIAVFMVGFAMGLLVSFKYVQKNTPAGQKVEIGTIKIKGKGHQVTTDVKITDDDQVSSRKKRRRRDR